MTSHVNTAGVQLALISNSIAGIVRKMSNSLLRTGRSGVLAMAREFSCCVVTAQDELLAAAESLPIHVLSGPDLMSKSMKKLHPCFKKGDAFLHNSPYHGCSHPADHTILVPIMDGEGNHRFTVQSKAHQADIGNSIPTTYFGNARDVYQEGAIIFPSVKVQNNYQNIDDIIRICQLRIRVPSQWWGDYLAMIGAARIGERELTKLGEEIGWDTLDEFISDWFDYSEKRMTNAIKSIPSGDAEHTSVHDAFPGTPTEGIPIHTKVKVDGKAGKINVDLRDNPDCLPCGLNLSEACSKTSAMLGVFNSIDHTVPKNAGSFRRLKVHLRNNCVVGIPSHPTSCSVATTNVADRVANGVQSAMAQLSNKVGMAECGAINPPAASVISGNDPRTGKDYVNQVFLGKTCGAASSSADAWQTISHVGNGGMCFMDSVELDELRHPIYVHSRGFVEDTEGAGYYCGSRAAFAIFGPQNCSMDIVYNSDGNINAPKGVRGGTSGASAYQHKIDKNGKNVSVPNCGRITLDNGELIVSYSCGGGGYGSPIERDPNSVAKDVSEGFITVTRAKNIYGVLLDSVGGVSVEETKKLRLSLREEVSKFQ